MLREEPVEAESLGGVEDLQRGAEGWLPARIRGIGTEPLHAVDPIVATGPLLGDCGDACPAGGPHPGPAAMNPARAPNTGTVTSGSGW